MQVIRRGNILKARKTNERADDDEEVEEQEEEEDGEV